MIRKADAQDAFEAWMASSNYPETAEIALQRDEHGRYKSQLTFAAFEGWKAGAHWAEDDDGRIKPLGLNDAEFGMRR